ncbi:MAG TPA: hypothetical protein P5191_00715, partial [Ruminococcus sp.]|nr:hypothetical protein [Ruminococcus sp.]
PDSVELPEKTEEDKTAFAAKFAGIKVGAQLPDSVELPEKTEEDKTAFAAKFAGIKVGAKLPDSVELPKNKKLPVNNIGISVKDIKLPKNIKKIDAQVKVGTGIKPSAPTVSISKGIDLTRIKPVINIKPTAMPVVDKITISDLTDVINSDRSQIGRNGTQ